MNNLDHFRQIFLNKKQAALNKLKLCSTRFENKRKRITSDIEQARLYFKEINDKLAEIKERKGVKDHD